MCLEAALVKEGPAHCATEALSLTRSERAMRRPAEPSVTRCVTRSRPISLTSLTVAARAYDWPGVRDSRTSECVAEDAIGPIIGYREWVLIADEILSPLARTPWGAGPMRAECLPDCHPAQGLWRTASTHPEPAPAHGCVCGIYALFTPQRSRGRERLAVMRGAVVLWGRIELHQRGMRAEFARIVTLALPSSRRRAAAVARVAELLDVEAVPARALPLAARAYGEPLDPTFIPE